MECGAGSPEEIQAHGDGAIARAERDPFQSAAVDARDQQRSVREEFVAMTQAEKHRRHANGDHKIRWCVAVATQQVLKERLIVLGHAAALHIERHLVKGDWLPQLSEIGAKSKTDAVIGGKVSPEGMNDQDALGAGSFGGASKYREEQQRNEASTHCLRILRVAFRIAWADAARSQWPRKSRSTIEAQHHWFR